MPKPDIRKSLEEATEEYQAQLQDDDEALTYLEGRGITSEAQDYFRLGIVRKPQDGHESYLNRLAFPYITPTGVVTIRFRVLGKPSEKQAKFLSLPGDESRLYNTQDLPGSYEIYLCEGETDTIACWQAELPAVGLPGASQWQSNSRIYSRIFANRRVTVLVDNDDQGAGLSFAQDVYRTLGGCKSIVMPQGHDVSSFIQEDGTEAFLRWLKR